MSVPTITSVTPSKGNAGGGDLVAVVGTNFRQYVPPLSGELEGDAPCYVQVLFGTVAATKAFVYSATSLEALSPAYAGDADLEAFAALSVTVKNLDDDLVPIPGEIAVKASAYTYEREHLRPPTLPQETPIVRISRLLLQLVKRQVVLLGSPNTHTDYSADGIDLVTAGIPTVHLIGPDLVPDAYGWENESIPELKQDGSVLVWPNPIMHTLTYEISGFSDAQPELLTLMSTVRKLFRRNPYLVIDGDVPMGSRLRLPLVMVRDPSMGPGLGNANLHAFTGGFEVRRVPILYLPPYYRTAPVDDAELQTQKVNGTLVEVKTLW